MSVVTGKISTVEGIVQATNPQTGEARSLNVGDEVFIGEVILTSPVSGVTITLKNGELLTLGRDTEMLLDDDVIGTISDTDTESGIESDALRQAILEGDLELEKLEETGAGVTVLSSNAGGEPLVERLAMTGSVTSNGISNTQGISENQLLTRMFPVGGFPVEGGTGNKNDVLVSIKGGAQNIVEGETSAVFTVSINQLPENVQGDIVVELIYSGTAENDKDFTGVSSVTIPAGSNSTTFAIDALVDALNEGSEDFTIEIGEITDLGNSFSGIKVDDNSDSVSNTISDSGVQNPDNSNTALISISGAQDIVEGETSTAFTVSVDQLVSDVRGPITVELLYSGTAIDGTDYTGVSSVTIPAGSNSVDFTIDALVDALNEGVEDFTITVGSITDGGNSFEYIGADPVANSVSNTISDSGVQNPDNSNTALISISGAQDIVEGETSTAFTVSVDQLPEDVQGDIVVELIYSGTAENGKDFIGVSSVTIPAGSSSVDLTIDTLVDALNEGAEDFTVTIGSITDTGSSFEYIDADTGANSVNVTIIDSGVQNPDDSNTALVSISGAQDIVEGETSTAFTVSVDQLVSDVSGPITVELLYSGTAEDGTDYTGVSSVTIPAGSNSTTFTIDTIDDALIEPTEDFTISIGNIIDGGGSFEFIAADPELNNATNNIVNDVDTPEAAYTFQLFALDDGEISYANGSKNWITEEEGIEAQYIVLAVDENGIPLSQDKQPNFGTITVNVGATGDTAKGGIEDPDSQYLMYDYYSGPTMNVTVGSVFNIEIVDDALNDGGDIFTLSLGSDWSEASAYEAVNYSSSTVTTTIMDEIHIMENNDSSIVLGTVSAADLNGDSPTFSIVENLQDADGNDIFVIDSATGELRFTEAGVYSYANDLETLPSMSHLTIAIDDGLGGVAIKKVILDQGDNANYALVGGNGDDFIDTPAPGGVDPVGDDDLLIGDDGGEHAAFVATQNYNVSLLIDTSESMDADSGQVDAYGNPMTRLDVLKQGLKNLAAELVNSEGILNIQLVSFNKTASQLYVFNDATASDLDHINLKIDSLTANYGTNYEAAFDKAQTWFEGQSNGYENLTYFFTDGEPTLYFTDAGTVEGSSSSTNDVAMYEAIDAFAGLSAISQVNAVGVGDDVTYDDLKYFDNTNVIDDGSEAEVARDKVQLLADFEGTNHPLDSYLSWTYPVSEYHLLESDYNKTLKIYNKDFTGSATTSTFTMEAGQVVNFDYIASFKSVDDTATVYLQMQDVNSQWVVVSSTVLNKTNEYGKYFIEDTGVENNFIKATTGAVSEDGTYRLVFEINSVSGSYDTDKLLVDNLQLGLDPAIGTDYVAPSGDPTIINSADQFTTDVINGFEPNAVGDDIIEGGFGNDILFGDQIEFVGYEGQGTFGSLINGLADEGDTYPTARDVIDYVNRHMDTLIVREDQGGNDQLDGGFGDDFLYGGAGDDILLGGLGDDVLIGGVGNDQLTGGEGADQFVIESGHPDDVTTITDYNAQEGDVLDISEVLQGTGVDAATLDQYLDFNLDPDNDPATTDAELKVFKDGDKTNTSSSNVEIIVIENNNAQTIDDLNIDYLDV